MFAVNPAALTLFSRRLAYTDDEPGEFFALEGDRKTFLRPVKQDAGND